MLRARHAIFAALFAAALAGVAQAQTAFSKNGCSIQFPKNWKTETPAGTTAFVFASAPDPDAANGQQQSATLLIARVSVANVDLMALAKNYQAGQGRDPQNKNYQAVEAPAQLNINAAPAVSFGGTYTSGNKALRNRVWLIAAEGRVYIVTFTALSSAWEKRLPAAEASVATFKLLDEKK